MTGKTCCCERADVASCSPDCDRQVSYKRPDGKPSIIKYEEIMEAPTESPGPEKYRYKPTDFVFPNEPTKPEEALATSRKILRELRGQPEPKLTVGDLSVSKKYEREHRVEENRRWLKNRERGLTVGDLSVVAARKNMQGGLDGLYEGQGAYVQPSMSASQKLAAEMMTNHREKAKEQQHLAEYRRAVLQLSVYETPLEEEQLKRRLLLDFARLQGYGES